MADEQRERLYLAADATVLALMNAVDAELKSTVGVLDALAASPRLARGDYDRFREEALELLARRPSWLNIVLSSRERQLVNAELPPEAPLPEVSAPGSVAEVFRTGTPLIGRVLYAPVVRSYAFAVLIPIRQNGRVAYVLTAVVRPDSLLDLLELRAIANQGVISIIDGNLNVVARSRNHDRWVGKSASGQLVDMLKQGLDRGRGATRTLEGVPVYTVFRRSAYSGWAVVHGAPIATLDEPMRNAYWMFGGAVFISILLGLAAALLVGRTIVAPMRELEQQALLLGSGQKPRMPQTRLPEVRRVAVALGAAHDARETAFSREHEARVAAEQASRAKDEFLAMLGHELRNPLAAITNASQLIEKKRSSLDESGAAAASIIGRQAKHLARLTDDLLDAGRVILGKISLSRAPMDLAATVRGSLDGLRGSGSLGRHRVDVELDSAWINADATRIDQIVSNLVTNAVKYTPPGGRVRVRTHLEGPWAVLTVSDTGIGLEPELLPRVFDLFVQGQRAIDRSLGGLGIGLTLVRRLAELHGGTAEAASAGTGHGATFTVRLPVIEAPEQAPMPAAPDLRNRPLHIALIEDNVDARESMRMLLELEGHRVSEAGDGISGVELITDTPGIDIAFVDIGLPGMSGYATAQGIRAARGRSIRLVAMSGYGAEQDVERGERAGFDAYIVKPADIERVRQELALVSQRSESASQPVSS